MQYAETINKCFAFNSVAKIFAALEKDNSDFAKHALKDLKHCCPLSLELTLEHLRTVPGQEFATAMRQEKDIARKFIAAGTFMQGITAVIINKQPANWDKNN